MTTTGPGGLLGLWEALASADPPVRGARLLVAAGVATDQEAALDLPLARASELALHELRTRCGPTLDTVVACHGCGTPLDVPLDLDAALDSVTPTPPEPAAVAGRSLRAPTTRDVVDALADPDPATALRTRCLGHDPGAAEETTWEQLAGAAALAARVDCPACGARFTADVDVVALLTDHLADQARVLLADVAELAAAYGWSEADILALPAPRRRAYLELVTR